ESRRGDGLSDLPLARPPRAADRRARPRSAGPAEAPSAHRAALPLDARAERAPGRPAPAPVRAHLRERSVPARRLARPARAHVVRPEAPGREPRPRDLVPPPLPRRRVDALRHREPLDVGRARP